VAITSGVLRDDRGVPYAVVFLGQDVTAQRLEEAQLRASATRDCLTGLLNRASFLRALEEELRDEGSVGCGVLFADLDGFKAANDTHGHQVGDLLLCAVAERLVAAARVSDLVCRYGGDEFVVLCRGADARGVHQVRSAIEATMDAQFATPHGLVRLGLSVGTALGRHGDAAAVLVAAADRHMYGVKTTRRAGRGR
jgi:cyclic di-GMP phosphodiesterase Gmr